MTTIRTALVRGCAWTAFAVLLAASPAAAAEDVVWTNLVNATATGNTLQKTSGCDGCQDAGASSVQAIDSGDGYAEFTASELTTQRVVGLSHGDTDTTRADIDFGIQLWPGGTADVRESGAYRAETSYVTGDVFRIAVESGVVSYSKNGTVFYRSLVSPALPLWVDASLYSLNATVNDAVILGAGAGADTTPPAVRITSPADGATVSGTVSVEADASDNEAVAGVRFFVDGAQIGSEDAEAPYSVAWDTSTAADGSHTLTAAARDAAGNSGTSSPVTVTVANAGGDAGPEATGGRVEEDHPAIAYVVTDFWYPRFSPGYSNGRVRASPHAGQRAVLTFTGTAVTFIGYRASNTGIAAIHLDGALVAEVDTFSPAPLFQQPLYSASGLTPGVHTITIEVTGAYSTPTGSAWIAVDAFDVVP
jgi:hypothetical protein